MRPNIDAAEESKWPTFWHRGLSSIETLTSLSVVFKDQGHRSKFKVTGR